MFSRDVLRIDPARVAEQIATTVRGQVLETLGRRGVVLGLSGGVDSSVVAALCARALGPDRVLGLLMPERDSSPDALRLGRACAAHLGIATLVEDIGPALAGLGCYDRQLEAIRSVVPAYGDGWRCKVVLPPLLEGDRLSLSRLVVVDPSGGTQSLRMPPGPYRQLIAATNFKQRTRTALAYYHADRLGYAVAGTPNLLECDQGFFVKQGDGAADIKPIAHLYKSQVFALAEHLRLPPEIRERTPTSDTFSLPQTQEEFYFALHYETLDLCVWAHDHEVPVSEVAGVLDLTEDQVAAIFRDIRAKRRAGRYLRAPALLVAGPPVAG